MLFPVGSNVTINDFLAAGCANSQGKVVKYCEHLCCVDTGQPNICKTYTVRYRVENCHECMIVETEFCESELTAA